MNFKAANSTLFPECKPMQKSVLHSAPINLSKVETRNTLRSKEYQIKRKYEIRTDPKKSQKRKMRAPLHSGFLIEFSDNRLIRLTGPTEMKR